MQCWQTCEQLVRLRVLRLKLLACTAIDAPDARVFLRLATPRASMYALWCLQEIESEGELKESYFQVWSGLCYRMLPWC